MRSLLLLLALIAAPALAQTAQDAVTTLKAQAKLVVVDVTVTDSKGNPVHGLLQKDFALLEDGQPRVIKSFQDHTNPPSAGSPAPKLPPGTFTNYSPPPPDNAVTILLLDSLNTPLLDQQYVRAELLDFLKKEPAGARIAIFGLSTKLVLLQDFTADPEILKRVVLRQVGKLSPLLADPTGVNGGGPSFDEAFNAEETSAHFATFNDIERSSKAQARGLTTLNGLNQLARYLAAIPGRKNLVWFSESFPVDIVPDSDFGASDPFAATSSIEDEYRQTVNLFASSRVAVYPVDAGGLRVGAGLAATGGSFSSKSFNSAQKAFSSGEADVHYTMNKMADETGGRATYNSNGLAQAVSNAINDGSYFYTLTYTPANNVKRDDFHKLQVKLIPQGLNVNYRRGFFEHDASLPREVPAKAAAPGTHTALPSQPTSMERAMAFTAPDSTQMIFKFRVLPATGQAVEKLAPGNVANLKAQAPYRTYAVDYAGDPRSVEFTTTPDGILHGSVNFVALVFTRDGTLINSLSSSVDVNLDQALYDDMLRHGLHYHQEISVPDAGDYILRVGLHDLGSDRIGTAGIRIAGVKDLPPLSSHAKPAAADSAR